MPRSQRQLSTVLGIAAFAVVAVFACLATMVILVSCPQSTHGAHQLIRKAARVALPGTGSLAVKSVGL